MSTVRIRAAAATAAALSTAAVVAVTGAAPTSAASAKITPTTSGNSCASRAKVVSGTIVKPGYDVPSGGGMPVVDHAKDRVEPYLTHAFIGQVGNTRAVVQVEGATFTFTPRSLVHYTCMGESKAEGAIFPNMELYAGAATVTNEVGHLGAVWTNTGLVNALDRTRSLTFSVRLTDTSPNNVEQGNMIVHKLGGEGTVNITPYVGPHPGSCREILHEAQLLQATRAHKEGVAIFDGQVEK